jgi:hypothetical protein
MLHTKARQEFRNISDCTIGAIFLGTPHQETETKDYDEILVNVARALIGDGHHNLVEALRVNSAAFLQLNSAFLNTTVCPIYNFYETKAMSSVGAIVRAKTSFHTSF